MRSAILHVGHKGQLLATDKDLRPKVILKTQIIIHSDLQCLLHSVHKGGMYNRHWPQINRPFPDKAEQVLFKSCTILLLCSFAHLENFLDKLVVWRKSTGVFQYYRRRDAVNLRCLRVVRGREHGSAVRRIMLRRSENRR